jgi:hypothetical protein
MKTKTKVKAGQRFGQDQGSYGQDQGFMGGG